MQERLLRCFSEAQAMHKASQASNNAGVTALSAPPAQDPALVALGRSLFFDKELSGDRTYSRSTCHSPAGFTGDATLTSIGAGGTGENQLRVVSSGSMVARNAPPLFNLGAGNTRMFWDGRVSRDNATGALTTPESTLNGITPARADVASQLTSALAAQAMFPVASDVEMRGAVGNEIRAAADNQAVWAALMARLVGTNNGTTGGMAADRSLFSAAYPGVAYDDLNFGHAARAIAAFETASYAAVHSPLDEFLRGNPNALSADAKAGGLLFFGRAGCGGCHRGPLLSDANFHGIAAPQLGPGASGGDDQGIFLISGSANDNYHFRTPALRNVETTAPYTHAGAYTTLAAVIAHYSDTATGLRNYNGSGTESRLCGHSGYECIPHTGSSECAYMSGTSAWTQRNRAGADRGILKKSDRPFCAKPFPGWKLDDSFVFGKILLPDSNTAVAVSFRADGFTPASFRILHGAWYVLAISGCTSRACCNSSTEAWKISSWAL